MLHRLRLNSSASVANPQLRTSRRCISSVAGSVIVLGRERLELEARYVAPGGRQTASGEQHFAHGERVRTAAEAGRQAYRWRVGRRGRGDELRLAVDEHGHVCASAHLLGKPMDDPRDVLARRLLSHALAEHAHSRAEPVSGSSGQFLDVALGSEQCQQRVRRRAADPELSRKLLRAGRSVRVTDGFEQAQDPPDDGEIRTPRLGWFRAGRAPDEGVRRRPHLHVVSATTVRSVRTVGNPAVDDDPLDLCTPECTGSRLTSTLSMRVGAEP
jgi:hypothetical protein